MAKYKLIFEGEEVDRLFDSEEDAEEEALERCSCTNAGAETMHLSNPGDYDYDEDDWEDPQYEIIEVEE